MLAGLQREGVLVATFPWGCGDPRLLLAGPELVGLVTSNLEERPVEEELNCEDSFTSKKFFKCKYSDIQYRTPLILLPE